MGFNSGFKGLNTIKSNLYFVSPETTNDLDSFGNGTQASISLICNNSVRIKSVIICFRGNSERFWSAIIFYECKDDRTALQFCKPCYDTIPVKSTSANVSFYTNNSKTPNFEFWHPCRKWAIRRRQRETERRSNIFNVLKTKTFVTRRRHVL